MKDPALTTFHSAYLNPQYASRADAIHAFMLTKIARDLYAQQNVTVLPGTYLSRSVDGINPGQQRVRMALVAEFDECIEAAKRIRSYVESIS